MMGKVLRTRRRRSAIGGFGALLALGLAAALWTPASAGPFEEGMKAMNRGDRGAMLRILEPLASQGDAAAAMVLGQMYERGPGEIDYPRAMIWYRRAAARGSLTAAVDIGSMYEDGEGVAKDPRAAAEWFKLAADKGDPHGQFALATMLADDTSGMTDYPQAYVLFTLASPGFTKSPPGLGPLDRRAELARKMTPAQIAEAERRLASHQ